MKRMIVIFVVLVLSACVSTEKTEYFDKKGNKIGRTCNFIDISPFYHSKDCKEDILHNY